MNSIAHPTHEPATCEPSPAPGTAPRDECAGTPHREIEVSTRVDGSADSRRTADVPPAPTAFGKYELLGKIAEGGMGIIYRARDRELGRVVALKMLRSGAFADDDELKRFQRETQAAAQLSHPNIVTLHEVGVENGRHFFTMAYVPRGSLKDHLDGFQEPRAAALLVEKVARAVHFAHERGILHRDLKPGNILLDERGEPLVGDFGLAKIAFSDIELTQEGEILGTPAYMAPEQVEGKPAAVGPAADVWALGVMLCELLCGRKPFTGRSRDEVHAAIRAADPTPPRSVAPKLPWELDTIALKCLEKEPKKRYASAGELADDLARWLRDEPIRVRPEGWARRVWRKVRRQRRLVQALAVVGLLVAAAIVATVLLMSPPAAEPTAEQLAELRRQAALKDFNARLVKGEQVELLGKTGRPRTYQWLTEVERQVLLAEPGEPLSLESWTIGFLELMPSLPIKEYRLRVSVRHTGKLGEAGIFVMCTEHRQAEAREHWLLSVALRSPPKKKGAEAQPANPEGRAKEEADFLHVTPRRFRARVGAGQGSSNVTSPFVRTAPPPDEQGWQHWIIDVTSAGVLIRSTNGDLLDLGKDKLDTATLLLRSDDEVQAGLQPSLRRDGAIGLYVHNTKAEFGQVSVERLDGK